MNDDDIQPRRRSLQCLGPHGLHRVAYLEWGDPDNSELVVCVHGLTRTGRDFDALARALAPRRRVLAVDVVGRGDSDWLAVKADYVLQQYLADMVALIARADVERVDWVGTSMGGLIGMSLAALPGNPIRRLVLNDVGPQLPAPALARIARYVGNAPLFPDYAAAEAYIRYVSAPFGPHSDAQWRHLTESAIRPAPGGGLRLAYDPGIADAFAELAQSGEDIELWPLWDAIRCPTLVLRGAVSDLLSAETVAQMAQRGPRARAQVVENVGHAPTLMSEAQIAPVVSFLLDTPAP